MPVQYTSISDEHQAVRNNVGVFDISHMGQLIASGPNAREWLNRMLTNNVDKLEVRAGQYTFLLNQNGGIIDDLIVYRIEPEKFLLVVNASRTDEDFAWLQAHILPDVELTNRSEDYAGLAMQGPRVGELLKAIARRATSSCRRGTRSPTWITTSMQLAIARTGYTGEDGVEVFFPAKYAPTFWTTLLEKGQAARHSALRPRRARHAAPRNVLSAKWQRSHARAHAARSGPRVLRRSRRSRISPAAKCSLKQKEEGLKRRLAPFRMNGKGPPPRPHYAVFRDDEKLGEVNSGTLSPSLGYGIGMAYLPTEHAKIGTELQIEIRGQKFPAVIEKKPLYKKQA